MQFSAKSSPNNRLAHPLWGWRPIWEILDLPLIGYTKAQAGAHQIVILQGGVTRSILQPFILDLHHCRINNW